MRKIVLFFSVLLVILGSINLSYATDVNSTIDSKVKNKKELQEKQYIEIKEKKTNIFSRLLYASSYSYNIGYSVSIYGYDGSIRYFGSGGICFSTTPKTPSGIRQGSVFEVALYKSTWPRDLRLRTYYLDVNNGYQTVKWWNVSGGDYYLHLRLVGGRDEWVYDNDSNAEIYNC
ncbi:hypothetical protein HXK64_00235 [Candidatus Gracilibacteria bacterium]|nr:hypothetical protein [Candidatus Gracilibacteria bacterium]